MKNMQHPPFIIGIAGGSGSGKSTFCDCLAAQLAPLHVKTFHMDEYYKPEAERPHMQDISGVHPPKVDDNHPDAIDIKRLCFEIKQQCEQTELDTIIVEGLFVLYDLPLCALLDLRLYVDCRADERVVRRLRRNMEWGLTFDQVAQYYLDMARHRHDTYVEPSKWKADMVINGAAPFKSPAEIVAGYLRSTRLK